jgi:glucose-1-phosphate adenylyltransferase
MPKPKVLALVMAGGEGSRLELLTERRAKPALPHAGVYRLIDFPLSNCLHSGIEHRMAGYWRDVGTVPAYWRVHMDLLDPERPLDLDDPDWPVLGRAPHRLPARVEGSARLDGALLSPGTVVAGEVTRSVLGPGVVVEPGAVVREAVLLDDCVVAAGALVERAVLDRGVRVGPGAGVGGRGGDGPALVGEDAQVPGGTVVAPGGRFPNGEATR